MKSSISTACFCWFCCTFCSAALSFLRASSMLAEKGLRALNTEVMLCAFAAVVVASMLCVTTAAAGQQRRAQQVSEELQTGLVLLVG